MPFQLDDEVAAGLIWLVGATAGGPPILYVHGGGIITGDLVAYNEIIKRYVSRTSVPFLLPEYRLAPEFMAPTPVTDCYTALTYLVANASELGIDPRRIGLMGDCAGGGIATSLAHYVKPKGGPGICKQIFLYPMLDDRNLVPDPLLVPYAVWSYEDNATGWRALLGHYHETDPVISPVHAAGCMEVPDARSLPDTYIDVDELDTFRDECLEYARKLGKAGVSCEAHVVPGEVHLSELLAPEKKLAKTILAWRDEVIASI
ncbi:hypothetical protein M433DRAFT_6734 [Acidomyces richmondensis BFW]|nr:hypothetical protein M433DRAFT_6734 [Acidomyces richmondensis BFW]